MKILPAMASAIPFLREDGKTVERLPFQVFSSPNGSVYIRIGPNVLVFDKTGAYDGTEHRFTGSREEAQELVEALKASIRGTAPEEPFFQPDTPGFAHETRDWKNAIAAGTEQDGKLYAVAYDKKEPN